MLELNNAGIKAVKELQGVLIGVGIFSNVVASASIFLIPTSISTQTSGGIVIRYIGTLAGLGSGGVSVIVGMKLSKIKPLEYAASKVENDLAIQQLANAQFVHQNQLSASTQEALKLIANSVQPPVREPEPVGTEPELEPEPNPNSKSSNPDSVMVHRPEPGELERTEPSEPQTEPGSGRHEELVAVEVESTSYFDKKTLHDPDVYQDEVQIFSKLYLNHKVTNKLELCRLMWGEMNKGSSKDWSRASEKINLIANYAQIETGWG